MLWLDALKEVLEEKQVVARQDANRARCLQVKMLQGLDASKARRRTRC